MIHTFGAHGTPGSIKKKDPEETGDVSTIFESLQLACQSKVVSLMTISLDCIGKLFSYNYLVEPDQRYTAEGERGQQHEDNKEDPGRLLIDRAVDVVCDCFIGENTDDQVQLQIIKALLAAVSSTVVPIHQSSLLKSIRTSYNIFLLSRNSKNQTIAQGTLTQMIHHVFGRINISNESKFESQAMDRKTSSSVSTIDESRSEHNFDLEIKEGGDDFDGQYGEKQNGEHDGKGSLDAESVYVEDDQASVKLENADENFNEEGIVGTPVKLEGVHALEFGQWNDATNSGEDVEKVIGEEVEDFKGPESAPVEEKMTLSSFENRKSFEAEHSNSSASKEELFVKDAFLVFRSLCKLSMKSMPTSDLKSHSMRSKLLSLHLILTILNSHINVFLSPNVLITSSTTHERTMFVLAIKQYLCLSLSRNAASHVPQVFEISLEIFWKCISKLRSHLKKEIEVFVNEIFLPILEMRGSSTKQKCALLNILARICSDPQTLVEIYLNYDCDREAMDNTYERIVNIVSKITTTYTAVTSSPNPVTINADKDSPNNGSTISLTSTSSLSSVIIPPSLSTKAITESTSSQLHQNLPDELALKYQGLECLVSILRSLVAWCGNKSSSESADEEKEEHPRRSEETIEFTSLQSSHTNKSSPSSSTMSVPGSMYSVSTDAKLAKPVDDPEEFGNLKQRKQVLQEGIKTFNFKPQKGISSLVAAGFIKSTEPAEIARFLLTTEGLGKAMIGEYLGEGEPENIATMHAFVDLMNFENMNFVDALRSFLQSFRLPGEAQKIDRFMLKFAERYVDGNPNQFANADTAYVLAYSVIMLNTDLHNPQIKRRMTKEEFVKNNRGINDNSDLPEEFLASIFEEIQNNEIKMKDEHDAALMQQVPASPGGIGISNIGSAIVNAGRDHKKAAHQAVLKEMANKTETLFKSMLRAQRRGIYTANTTFYSASHFEHVRPMFSVAWMPVLAGLSGPLQDTEDMETANLALEGFKLAIRIICLFDMELERNAFVTTLAKFTFLNNLGEMKPKNVDAIKTLLDIALTEGNYLKDSWKEVLTCVSQLERFQLISSGLDQDVVPGISVRKSSRHRSLDNGTRRSISKRSFSSRPNSQITYAEDVALESKSSQVVVAVDRIFSSSSKLSGTAIVEFVRALSGVSWEEIQSSTMTEHPRMFSLQKLVEISYYNMGRIRMEWSNVWAILGEHFNQVGCHPNINIGFFAIDSLRQLAMQFLAKEELPHFKFQKDFLRPFEHILTNSSNISIKDMVLRCIQQMIQAKSHNIKSGWKSLFGVCSAAAREDEESIVSMAFDIVRLLINDQFDDVVSNSNYPDLMMLEYPQYRIHEPINGSGGVTPTNKVITNDDPSFKFWYPLLFGFHDVVMNGEDLENDTLARIGCSCLQQLIVDNIKKLDYDHWGKICSKFVQLFESTTPYDLLDEDRHFVEAANELNGMYSGQNESGVNGFVSEVDLNTRSMIDDNYVDSEYSSTTTIPPNEQRAQEFNQIITKCLLQLLLIDVVNELLSNELVYELIPSVHLLIIGECLEKSYRFARKFNEDKNLRIALWKIGFMRQLPNLLKQESSSASCYLNLLVRMHRDDSADRREKKEDIEGKLVPLSLQIFKHYNSLDHDSQSRNINAWTPVVISVLNAYVRFDDDDVREVLIVIS
ncbi:3698_t:CDS:10 [Acaulospora colombiana]|uniref:3698_t:CDS:1 n=1 Tax=Acaulospora colombiana TaxID=27376 RepID=A0ACA9K3Z3_9GLOM|nr:3698_t:CDS:10 [Acaulospora colombiana]